MSNLDYSCNYLPYRSLPMGKRNGNDEEEQQAPMQKHMVGAVNPNAVKKFVKPSAVKQYWTSFKNWFIRQMEKPKNIELDEFVDNAQMAWDIYDAYNKYNDQMASVNSQIQNLNYSV